MHMNKNFKLGTFFAFLHRFDLSQTLSHATKKKNKEILQKHWIVLTTVQKKTECVIRLAELWPKWQLLVIGRLRQWLIGQ